ncbi:MAG TPA: glycosyltransferase 61 family protein [Solirubrobacterales bacterium]
MRHPISSGGCTILSQTLEIYGQTELRPRGSLKTAAPRELWVERSLPAAFEPSGLIAADTRRLWGEQDRLPDSIPDRLSDPDVVAVHKDETVWGGCVLGHYGHFLTESVSRLWPLLPEAELKGLPVVCTMQSKFPFAREWAQAFGIDVAELPERGVVRFMKMFVPDPAWRLNVWISPEIRDIHMHARQNLSVPPCDEAGVLWLSRSGLDRNSCAYDEVLLEWILRDHVTLIHPEQMTLVEQIAAVEASEVVAGIVGSAFHTLLMAAKLPTCVLLCPGGVQPAFLAQDLLLRTNGAFIHALSIAEMLRRRRGQSLGGYRVMIPETVRALGETVLPALLEDERLLCFAYPERFTSTIGEAVANDSLERMVARVLLDPYSFEARLKLAAAFECRELFSCALEQFLTVAELSDNGHVPSLLGASRMFDCLNQRSEASSMARQVLALDPSCRDALAYLANA